VGSPSDERTLEQQPDVDRHFTELLRFVIDVANRAVHGFDVNLAGAQQL
jgi:hypothetical protein